jgi:outer membrane protein assembly factor BamA
LEGRSWLFASRSTGLGLAWQQPLSIGNALGVRYVSERSATSFPFGGQGELPPGLPRELTARSSRRTLGISWSHFQHNERLLTDTSLSGGILGGTENLVQSSVEYVRLRDDPFSGGRNTWAFRGFLAGAGSFGGKALPLHSRLFAGEELVRGFRTGALAPYTITSAKTTEGGQTLHLRSGGANLVVAGNTEYRMPLPEWTGGANVAAFFDAGAGWLLPGWLGGDAPELLGGTNGVLHTSSGVELRVPLSAVRQNLRLYYAVNPLRLAESLLLPDGSAFRPGERRSAFGWALGALF